MTTAITTTTIITTLLETTTQTIMTNNSKSQCGRRDHNINSRVTRRVGTTTVVGAIAT